MTTTAPSINEQRKSKAIVIGGGFGGLATAIRLQAAGQAVTLIEAREHLGGRAYQLKKDGFTFDMGPSLITAPHLLEDIWTAAGRSLKDDITLVPLSPFYRIYFQDGRYFDYWGTAGEDKAGLPNLSLAMWQVTVHFLRIHNVSMSVRLPIWLINLFSS